MQNIFKQKKKKKSDEVGKREPNKLALTFNILIQQ